MPPLSIATNASQALRRAAPTTNKLLAANGLHTAAPISFPQVQLSTSASCTRRFSSTLISSESSQPPSDSSPFSFLPRNKLPVKKGLGGREKGLTEIRGSYYNPVTQTYLNELLSDWGEFVDGVKFAGGAFTLLPPDRLKSLIQMIHNHGTYVSTGGYIERVISTSGGDFKTIGKYLETCKEMGFDVLEISSGFLTIPEKDWSDLVKLTKSIGLKPKPEIGILFGAGGDTEGLENAGTRDPKWLIQRAESFLDAGADKIMIESEGITENVKNWRTDVISSISSSLPMEKLMFEAAEPAVFQYYVQNFGADVNVFIDHSQIVQLACVRKGIWGKSDLFNRVVTFKPDEEK